MREPLKILFKFPCRGRETMFFESLNSLNINIRDRNNYHIALTIDEDDLILNRPEVMEVLSSYPNTSIQLGLSKSKIEAINRSMPDYDYDVLICWSNDQFALMYGFDDVMRADCYNIINNHGEKFLLHYPDMDAKHYLNVLYVASRAYYEQFNYIYHPSYLSLFCDNETMRVSQMLGQYYFIGTTGLYVHENPAYTHHGRERDELFNHQQGLWAIDEANFEARKRKNFDLHLIEGKWETHS